MTGKEIDYIRSRDAAEGAADEKTGVYIDAFDNQKDPGSMGKWDLFIDSFRRFDTEDLGLDPNLSEVEKAAIITANSPLSRSLKNRHLQMIAIGGSIGTGLFIGSGSSLNTGGPAGLLIAYIIVGTMIYCTVQSLGELAVTFPVAGAFVTYNTRFICPSWGFAMAWNYAIQWLVVCPLELVAGAIAIQYWDPDQKYNPAAWVAIFYVLIVAINLFGVRGYGEAEFFFSIIKVAAVIGFIILGIVLCVGGGPRGGYIGNKYYQSPGAFSHSFKGVCSVFVTAAFAFSGTELCGLAAAETQNPRVSLPKATKQVFWRITLFYVISLTLVGLLVPYNDNQLFGASDASSSPFVIPIKHAGISGLPSVMNVVILISVLSVGNSSVFGSSRTLAALAACNQAPKIFNYIDKQGRPLVGILVQCIIGLLCFVVASSKENQVFNWLYALAGLSAVFTWGSINVCHIRFRRALQVQGRDISELPFASQVGVIGAYYGALMNFLVLVAQFWVALFPLGKKPDPSVFFQDYLSFPVILAFYVAHKLWTRNWVWFIRAKDINIDVGRRELDLDLLRQEIAEEKAAIARRPLLVRIFKYWC